MSVIAREGSFDVLADSWGIQFDAFGDIQCQLPKRQFAGPKRLNVPLNALPLIVKTHDFNAWQLNHKQRCSHLRFRRCSEFSENL